MNQKKGNVNKLTMLGMMTALVFVSNYLRITMPIAIGGRTSFTLANIMCCLSGLLLGPVGGFASGLGSAIYDLTNPAYAPECWITFLTKGVMGMVAGLAMKDRLLTGAAPSLRLWAAWPTTFSISSSPLHMTAC